MRATTKTSDDWADWWQQVAAQLAPSRERDGELGEADREVAEAVKAGGIGVETVCGHDDGSQTHTFTARRPGGAAYRREIVVQSPHCHLAATTARPRARGAGRPRARATARRDSTARDDGDSGPGDDDPAGGARRHLNFGEAPVSSSASPLSGAARISPSGVDAGALPRVGAGRSREVVA